MDSIDSAEFLERSGDHIDLEMDTRLITERRAEDATLPSDVHGPSTLPGVLVLGDEKALTAGAAGHLGMLDEEVTALSTLRLDTDDETVDDAHAIAPRDLRATLQPGSLISRLPPELLAYIMELTTLCALPWSTDHWIYVALREWLPTVHDLTLAVVLSHVCHGWRQIALNTASLWTALRFKDAGPQTMPNRALLSRTKAALLVVYAEALLTHRNAIRSPPTTPSSPPLEYATMMRDLMSRAEHSWISRADPSSFQDAPFLESLHVCPPTYDGAVELPKHAPKLRTLSIENVDCRGDQLASLVTCPLLAQLTRLAISFNGEFAQGPEDITHLLGVLERAPTLTDLAIRNRTRDMEWEEWATDLPVLRDPIVLPRLERLTLVGDQIVMVAILNNIRLPEQLELWLQPEDGEDAWSDEPELNMQMLFVRRHLSRFARKPSKLVIAPLALPIRKHFWLYESLCAQFFGSDGRRLLTLPVQASVYGCTSWLVDILAVTPWDTVTEMRLYLAAIKLPGTRVPFTEVLRATCLEILHVDASAVAQMVNLIGVHGPPSPFLPALRTLVAVGVRVGDIQALLQAREGASSGSSKLDRLVLGRSEFQNLDEGEAQIVESWRLCIKHVQLMACV
jgi:hypothetical protein